MIALFTHLLAKPIPHDEGTGRVKESQAILDHSSCRHPGFWGRFSHKRSGRD